MTALSVVADSYRRGMTEPLPFFPSLSRQVYDQQPAAQEWLGARRSCEENRPATEFAFGHLDFDGLMGLAARTDDPPGPGGRVERFARYLFAAVDASVDIGPRQDGVQGP